MYVKCVCLWVSLLRLCYAHLCYLCYWTIAGLYLYYVISTLKLSYIWQLIFCLILTYDCCGWLTPSFWGIGLIPQHSPSLNPRRVWLVSLVCVKQFFLFYGLIPQHSPSLNPRRVWLVSFVLWFDSTTLTVSKSATGFFFFDSTWLSTSIY
jgi:hypothetical protein